MDTAVVKNGYRKKIKKSANAKSIEAKSISDERGIWVGGYLN